MSPIHILSRPAPDRRNSTGHSVIPRGVSVGLCLFQAASISKPVAALVTLRLVAQGALSLEGDVNEYLTSWRLPGGDGDLVRSAQVIQAAAAGEAGALLPPPLALEMVTPQAGGWGLGLMLSGQGAHRCFGHGGGNYGCQCILIGAVSGRKAVAVMTSSDPSLPVIWSLLAAVRDATSWSDLPASGGEWR